jgi:tetratricopeptide (TPR) repeat protein
MKKLACWGLVLVCVFANFKLPGQSAAGKSEEIKQLILDKKFREAVDLSNLLLTTDSLNPQLYYCLGLAYSNLKQYKKACFALEKANIIAPGNKPLLLNLADCYCEVADAPAAEVIILDLIRADSADTFVWLQLAQVYQRQSKADEAIGIYLKLWSEDSTNIWYPRQIGSMLSKSERYKEAVPYLETVVETDSTDQGSYLRLAQAYVFLKAYEKIPVLDKAIRQDSMQPQLRRYRGGLWLGSGEYELAENDLKIALELGDTTAFTCRHLGISQFQQSKYEDALYSFSKTVELDSLDSEAWFYLGYCNKWTENLPRAIECMTHALKLAVAPSTGSIYSGLALFYNLQRDLKKAMTCYEKAVEYNPVDAYPYSQLGLLVEQTTRDKELAKRYYEQFIRQYTGGDSILINYVNDRLEQINEKLFMEGKIKKK